METLELVTGKSNLNRNQRQHHLTEFTTNGGTGAFETWKCQPKR